MAGPATSRARAGQRGGAAQLQASIGNRAVQQLLAAAGRPAGGRPLPAALRGPAERAFSADFSGVRTHDDAAAARMTAALGAHAFTTGGDIYFAAGRYQPTTRGGAWLLAHELAHVRQQDGGPALQEKAVTSADHPAEQRADAAADAFIAGRSVPALGTIAAGSLSRVVVTNGGVFDTTEYQPTAEMGTLGAAIRLTFTPNDLVPRGDKIGLIQTVNSTVNGNPSFADPLNGRVALADGSADPGRAIDRNETSTDDTRQTNPVYGSDNTHGHVAHQLTDNAPTGDDQLGYRTWFGANVPARLYDTPGLDRGRNRGQQFETAAVLLEGAKAGLYLGSIAWGWQANANGTAAVLNPNPIRLVSRGAPSGAFRAAAAQWNQVGVNGNQNLVAVPTNAAPVADRALADMTDQEVQAAIDAIDAQILQAATVAGGRRQLKLEKQALLAEKTRRGMLFGMDLNLA